MVLKKIPALVAFISGGAQQPETTSNNGFKIKGLHRVISLPNFHAAIPLPS